MGSTSYDEAREATDPRWAGASWYGPTTGEYWIVNPREYADPRKHGPGYSGRARSGLRPDEVDVRPGPATDGLGSAATTAEHRGPADDGAGPDARVRSAGASVPPAAGPPAEPAWNPGARAYAGSASAHAPTSQVEPDQEPTLERTLRSLVAGLFGANPVDPVHRVALALVAWPPIGIAAASTIGQLTGCASYAVTCGGTDPILPWLAQAVVVGLLLLATPLARLLAAGTLGLVAGLLPAMAVLIAFGGARSGTAGPALAAIVAVAWLIGAAWGIRTGIWRGAATAGPPRGSS